jgi:uncharacterized Zn finger protein (UPF0148 family)
LESRGGKSLKQYVPDGTEIKGKACPSCGNQTLIYQEGCLTCKSCGIHVVDKTFLKLYISKAMRNSKFFYL